ncbi:DUF4832 domain-containing protein [Jeotgalibacillus salarius]|uniref:DUF4832 domain-containing protein n=1 Tax=Jeotgalibacillus salarius TaxID=546023 RepID=A0A4Y8LFY3_9BACL|nr:DUF4832 domain-containing protein [Jeotgalibacillus salarius]TFE01724.1 DUF4832 domain-containing protein [Jeotgalibacillus salarius]
MKRKTVILIVLIVILTGSISALYAEQMQIVTEHPPESGEVILNPYIGFAPMAEGGPYTKDHSLVYANIPWSELESSKGVYEFGQIETKYKFHYWKERNVRFILRIIMDKPDQEASMEIPEWLYEEIGRDGTWYDGEYGKGFSPNYSNSVLIERHKELLKAFGERYNDDPYIAFIQLGSIGHWGEWHTIQNDELYIPFPDRTVTTQYVNHYLAFLDGKMLMMRRPHQIAAENNIGLYNDMFGDENSTVNEFLRWVNEGYTLWLTGENKPAMKNYWKTAPAGGEFDPTKSWEEIFGEKQFPDIVRQLELSHLSWLGPHNPLYEENSIYDHQIEKFLGKMGYHLKVTQIKYRPHLRFTRNLKLNIVWENSGTAPFYFKWPLEVIIIDVEGNIVHRTNVDTDIRKWLPGETAETYMINLPAHLSKGDYSVLIAINDPSTGEPGVELEMVTNRDDKRYKIADFSIK